MDFKGLRSVRASDDIRDELQPYVLTQYSVSPIILSLLGQLRVIFDAQTDLEGFYDTLYSLERVGGYGMDVWGTILNIPRTFISETTGEKYSLTGSYFKLMLWLKAAANLAQADLGSFKAIILGALESAGNTSITAMHIVNVSQFVSDDGKNYYASTPMTVRINTEGEPDEKTIAILAYLIPFILAAGVWWDWLAATPTDVFGFLGSELQPFDQAPFVHPDAFAYNFDKDRA